MTDAPWTLAPAAVGEAYGVDPAAGLSQDEAGRRLRAQGENRLDETRRRSAWAILADQFESLIFALLFAAAVASFVFGETVQSVAILVAILVNAAIGFFTELRARRSMEALRALGRAAARVRRDGEPREIDAARLVPGDVVLIESGAVAPADLRLIETDGLRIDESTLTGESAPVGKTPDAIGGAPPLAERANMAFKGTAVGAGAGVGVVVATGMDTELGRISRLAEEAGGEESPLQRRLDRLARRLLVVILIVSAVVAALGVAAGRDAQLMVETGVALVVAAVPEGLPIVASVALARGMWRLAQRNALIERLSAVETLGATTVICTDKTGTLTENRMSLVRLWTEGGEATLGREAGDRFERDGAEIDPRRTPPLRAALEVSALCNAASLGEDADGEGEGDPMELALLAGARRAGIARDALLGETAEVRREDFDPAIKMMATVHRAGEGFRVAVKGAPEAVIARCVRVLGENGETADLDDAGRDAWRERNDAMAGEGLRALALAEKTVADADAHPYEDLTLIGLAGLLDPPRHEVRDAVRECRGAGIRAVMVTGDQPQTARAIAEAVGLVDDGDAARVVLGADLAPAGEMDEAARARLLDAAVFARFDPKQKLDLVALYRAAGEVVAMTGDGVNDAPALRRADIGVAMGRRGAEVAREAADMVLRDDSFASIVAAIRYGRMIFGNIRRFVVYMLSGNAGEIFAVSAVALLAAPLPLLPLQILYINIVSDVFPALALGVGRARTDVMDRPPRDPAEPILTPNHWWAIGGYGVLIGASVLAVFWAAFARGMATEEAVTVSFLSFGFARLWHVLNMRDAGSSMLRNEITENRWVWVAIGIGVALMLAAAYVPILSGVLNASAPGAEGWALIALGSLAPLVLGQLLKLRAVGARLPEGLAPRVAG